MTKQEKLIVMAYTGVTMVDFGTFQEFVSKRLGRELWTHEFARPEVAEEIKQAVKEDFLKLCDKQE